MMTRTKFLLRIQPSETDDELYLRRRDKLTSATKHFGKSEPNKQLPLLRNEARK